MLTAREVELLAPAVRDGGRRPDNCEYPWKGPAGAVSSPLDYSFPHMALLEREFGHKILRAIDLAIQDLD